MKLDWQHVVVIVVGLGCGAACIVLGHGNTLVQVLAGVGTASGAVALVLRSVRGESPVVTSNDAKVVIQPGADVDGAIAKVFPPEEAPTKKEGP